MSDKSRLENNNNNLMDITNSISNLPNYIEIRNQNINITENGIYNADSGYTGFGEVNINVPSSGGDVKLFDTVENMNNDSSPVENGLAIVYSNINTTRAITSADLPVTSTLLPETITLSNVVTDIYQMWGGPSSGRGCHLQITLTPTYCTLTRQVDSLLYARYESTDGIHYTKTYGGNEINFAPR